VQEPDFTEHRIVVREGEGEKKKGWFSRKKKTSVGSPPSNVSRSPSTASFGSSRRKPKSNPEATEEDLPPRVEKDDPPPQYTDGRPQNVEPNSEAASSDVELPKHAGFDLNAMKAMIEDVELDPAELQGQDLGQHAVPPIRSPTNRSGSASPLHESPSMPVMRSSQQLRAEPEPESEAGPSSPTNLNVAFQRSMSMHKLDEGLETISSIHPQSPHSIGFGTTSHYTPSPSASSPTNGFASSWATESVAKARSPELGTQLPGPSTDAVSFGNYNGSITPYDTSHALPPGPFAEFSSAHVGLSFGGADGSIMPNTEAERDPWSSRPLQTKVSGLSPNPWQS
jgi:hypothetical protein